MTESDGVAFVQRYIVLAGSTYYPNGWMDYKKSFVDLNLAKEWCADWLAGDSSRSWAEVVDLTDMKIVWEGSC